ncbi:unnamed protein product [Lymnaea stagnalis]|uniref:Protein STPG4 n=1 Tax=Lymnaea stagnalis TaxID=6523 RepID=A0AAV2HMS6_LYMST
MKKSNPGSPVHIMVRPKVTRSLIESKKRPNWPKIAEAARKTSGSRMKFFQHPWEDRTLLSDAFENPITDRESWWRKDIKITPTPGTYTMTDFLTELSLKPNTYQFRATPRRTMCGNGKGALLLPGGYEYQDFITHLSKKPATYRFKAEERDAKDYLNFGIRDKYVDVPPNAYVVENYMSVDKEIYPVKSSMFRSTTKRFPTYIFRPKDGPSPGSYEIKDTAPKPPAVTSCFRSKTPRFNLPHTKVPDPGTYAKTFQHPMPDTISNLGRQHGLFFTSEFQL